MVWRSVTRSKVETEREASRSKSRTRLFIGIKRSHTAMVSQERSAHSQLVEFEFAQTTCHSMSSSSQRPASELAGSEFESSSSRVAVERSGGTPPPHLPSNFRGRPRPRKIPSGLGVADFLTWFRCTNLVLPLQSASSTFGRKTSITRKGPCQRWFSFRDFPRPCS